MTRRKPRTVSVRELEELISPKDIAARARRQGFGPVAHRSLEHDLLRPDADPSTSEDAHGTAPSDAVDGPAEHIEPGYRHLKSDAGFAQTYDAFSAAFRDSEAG